MSSAAVFLDRDGVLNPDVGFPFRAEDAVLFEDVAPALRKLDAAGFCLVIISNQSGIARGMFDMEQVKLFNRELLNQLASEGVDICEDNVFICPHGPRDGCSCRKPKPGLLLTAARQRDLDLKRSFLIGDREVDMLAGKAAGVISLLLDRTGSAAATSASFVVGTLTSAADIILDLAGAHAAET